MIGQGVARLLRFMRPATCAHETCAQQYATMPWAHVAPWAHDAVLPTQLEEEKKKREEVTGRIDRMKIELEEMRKKIPLPTQTLTNTPPITSIASNVITSLDGTSVILRVIGLREKGIQSLIHRMTFGIVSLEE